MPVPVTFPLGKVMVEPTELSLLGLLYGPTGHDEEVAVAVEVRPPEGERPHEVDAHQICFEDLSGQLDQLVEHSVELGKGRRLVVVHPETVTGAALMRRSVPSAAAGCSVRG